jgi:hypothetical protein
MNSKTGGAVIHQSKTTLHIIRRKDSRNSLVFFDIIKGARTNKKTGGQKDHRYYAHGAREFGQS